MPTAAVMGGMAVYGAYSSHKAAKKQEQQQAPLLAAQTDSAKSQSSLSNLMADQSRKQYQMSAPAYGKAISYYQTILGGSRAAQAQQNAPQVGQIGDAYRGAERNLERLGVRGGEATQAKAELGRQQAGQVGALTVGAQPGAAEKLGTLGNQGIYAALSGASGASGAAAGAGNTYANLLKSSYERSDINYGRQQQQGQDFMKIISPLLKRWQASRDGGGGGGGASDTNSGGAW